MGELILLPNLLDASVDKNSCIPQEVSHQIQKLDGLIAESRKEAIRYLLRFVDREKANQLPIAILSEHTTKEEIKELLDPIIKGQKWGCISDAGLPSLADPGASLVRVAHKHHIEVKTYSGPSSIIIALQLSGFIGQRFYFHGYLPRKEDFLKQKIKSLETLSKKDKATQIWIEAPYRSQKMLDMLLKTLHPKTYLCVASDLTMKTQKVISQPVHQWKKEKKSQSIGKAKAVFLIESSF